MALLPMLTFLAAQATGAVASPSQDKDFLQSIPWRGIGPTAMGGRITDIAVDPTRKSTYYVGAAGGGLWKTTNNGVSFRAVFDDAGSASIGDVAVAPSDPSVLWLGTGEANPRNSVSWGDGVYRSLDGGVSWEHRGLRESRHIGRIVIHPEDPATAYVAAMGHTWGPNPERGLYRTRDGGEHWDQVLFVDESTGCIDVLLDPRDPQRLVAAMWTRQRDTFDGGDPALVTGPGSGLFRSEDGGDSWIRLSEGLPTRDMGRIGLDQWAADPDVLFAIIQTDRTGRGVPTGPETRGGPPRLGVQGRNAPDQGPAVGYEITRVFAATGADNAGLKVGDVILDIGGHPTPGTDGLREAMSHYQAGDQAPLRLRRGEEEMTLPLTFGARPASDQSFNQGMQGGQMANRQDAQGDLGFETGGVFRSDDGGQSWRRINSLNPRPFYYSQIRVDPQDDSRLYVLGIAFHWSSDGGDSFEGTQRGAHPDHHALWVDPDDGEHLILGNDGGLYVSYDRSRTWDHHDHLPIAQFYGIAADNSQPYRVYGGLQDNGSWGGPSAAPWSAGVIAEDWWKIGGGDGFRCACDPTDPNIVYCESQNGTITRWELDSGRTTRIRASGRDRFNWNTPLLVSPHDPDVLWFAGSRLHRARRGGQVDSPSEGFELTRTRRGTASALSESPLRANAVYVGTDDGMLWYSPDGGGLWARVSDHFPGIPGPYWVSEVVASAHHDGTVYASLDGHRHDDDRPYVMRSEDHGYTWTRIDAGLPAGSVRCLAEDPVNPELIYAGTEFGCHASLDRGESWLELGSSLPTVAVLDLEVHRREAELIAGTHGRGIHLADVRGLQQLDAAALAAPARLLAPGPVTLWTAEPSVQRFSPRSRSFLAPNPDRAASLWYWLAEDQGEEVQLEIVDEEGRVLNRLKGPAERGLHRVRWDLSVRRGGDGAPDAGRTGRVGRRVTPGTVSVRWDLEEQPQELEIRGDPRRRAATSSVER